MYSYLDVLQEEAINRTILELKRIETDFVNGKGMLLIEPFWN